MWISYNTKKNIISRANCEDDDIFDRNGSFKELEKDGYLIELNNFGYSDNYE